MRHPIHPGRQLGEVPDQHGDVLGPLPKRRDPDRDHVEPMEEIFAECAPVDQVVQVLVGRGDDSHVHRHRSRPAHRGNVAALECSEDLGLRRERHVSDLVEEERPLVRLLELPHPVGHRSRKGALYVAEEFGLDQLGGDGGAVHLDKQLLPAGRAPVQSPGGEFLPGSVLSRDQDGCVGPPHLFDVVENLLDRA